MCRRYFPPTFSITASPRTCLKGSRDAVVNAAGTVKMSIVEMLASKSLKEVSCLKEMSEFSGYSFNYVQLYTRCLRTDFILTEVRRMWE